jgi:cytochrome P450
MLDCDWSSDVCSSDLFGAGPRVCIGSLQALAEMEATLAVVAPRVRLTREGPPVAFAAHVNLRPRDQVWVVPERRGTATQA